MKNIKTYRQDFPLLRDGQGIYLDNACQTLRPDSVIRAMTQYYEEYPACGGRSMHHLAAKVTQQCDQSRKAIAGFIGAKHKEEVIFTRNTTEGINLVANSFGLKRGDVIVTSDKEHNSNLIPWQILKERIGIVHKIIPTDAEGQLDLAAYEKALSGASLVAMVITSNLDGVSFPIEQIVKKAHKAGAKVLLDGAQAVPHQKIDVSKLDIDFLAFSGHKMLGPSGMGILYGKRELLNKLQPFLVGGDTVSRSTYETHEFLPVPEKFEAGLQDYAGIIGLGEAVRYLVEVGFEAISKIELELNAYVSSELKKIDGVVIIGPSDPKVRGGIVSFYIKGKDHHQIALMLDETKGICVRSGQHCVHSWFASRGISGSVRASFYFYNTMEEAKEFISNLKKVISIL